MMEYINALENMLLDLALVEDMGFPWRDVTTDLLLSQDNKMYSANILSKHHEPAVICGISLIHAIFRKLTSQFAIHSDYRDGDYLEPQKTLLTIEAPAQVLLKCERVTLNFLRHLSGISTLTAKYVGRVKGTCLKVLDTRKTTPGLRALEKNAVYCGGGVNHRMGLYDAVMVKDTHIDALGGIEKTMQLLSAATLPKLPIIIEVRSIAELDAVLEKSQGKVTRVLLDNMSVDALKNCVSLCQGRVETEASGNIRLENILEIAKTGVDYASVGELTYNAGHVDLSLEIC